MIDDTTAKNLIDNAKVLSTVTFITTSGVKFTTKCCIPSYDFLTLYNTPKSTMTFCAGSGGICKIVKKDVSVLIVEPISPFPEY